MIRKFMERNPGYGRRPIDLAPVMIFDPLNPQNNTTRTAYKFDEVTLAFKLAFQVLDQAYLDRKSNPNAPRESPLLAKIISSSQ